MSRDRHEETTTRLAASLLRDGWTVRLRVTGSSMKPILPPDGLVTVEPLAAAPRRGEIVLYAADDGRLVAHRVEAVTGEAVSTRGDAHRHRDAPVDRNRILGRITAIESPYRMPLVGVAARLAGLAVAALVRRLAPVLLATRAGAARTGVAR